MILLYFPNFLKWQKVSLRSDSLSSEGSIRTMRIPNPRPKKAFVRLDLAAIVEGKEVDVARNLALRTCDLHQQKKLIAFLHHVKQRHLFCHL
jgi:hypothetical protein